MALNEIFYFFFKCCSILFIVATLKCPVRFFFFLPAFSNSHPNLPSKRPYGKCNAVFLPSRGVFHFPADVSRRCFFLIDSMQCTFQPFICLEEHSCPVGLNSAPLPSENGMLHLDASHIVSPSSCATRNIQKQQTAAHEGGNVVKQKQPFT